jgi:hypothetical protein
LNTRKSWIEVIFLNYVMLLYDIIDVLTGLYIAPCYYSSIRVGSFIIAMELKTGPMPPEHWIKRATALLMNLDNWLTDKFLYFTII